MTLGELTICGWPLHQGMDAIGKGHGRGGGGGRKWPRKLIQMGI